MLAFIFWVIIILFLQKGSFPFIFPGIAIAIIFKRYVSDDLIGLVYAIGSSISLWVIFFWWQPFLSLSINIFCQLATALTIVVLFMAILKTQWKCMQLLSCLNKNILWSVIFLVLLFWLRVWPFHNILVPPGVDMSLHTLMGHIIYRENRLPYTLEPFFPIKFFPQGNWGFSAIAALMAKTGGLSIEEVAIKLTYFSHFFVGLALALFLPSNCSSALRIAIGGIVSLLSPSPQSLVAEGINPTVLSLAFVLLLASYLRPPQILKLQPILLIIGALFFAAAFIIQPIPVVAFVYIFIPPCFYGLWKRTISVTILKRIGLLLAGSLVLLLPFIIKFPKISPFELKLWIWGWQTYKLQLPAHLLGKQLGILNITNFWLVTVVFFVITNLGLSFCFLWKKGSGEGWYLFGVIVLLLNVFVWWLPFSFLLYPERIIALVLMPVPMVIFLCWMKLNKYSIYLRAGLLLLLLLFAFGTWWFKYAKPIPEKSAVTFNDKFVLSWMKDNLPPKSIIANNFSDAGVWIPVLTDFPVSYPHINPLLYPYLQHAFPIGEAGYIFIGEREIYTGGTNFNIKTIEKDPRHYFLLKQKGEAKLYQIKK